MWIGFQIQAVSSATSRAVAYGGKGLRGGEFHSEVMTETYWSLIQSHLLHFCNTTFSNLIQSS